MIATLPRTRGIGIAGTTIAHGALLLVAWIAARNAGAVSAPTYAVKLVAAPLPSAGPVPAAKPTPPAPPPEVPKNKQPAPKQVAPKPAVQAKQPQPTPATPTKQTPLPGVTPGTGQDVVTLNQPGINFPFQDYINKIANEVLKRWDQSGFRPGLHAQVSFIIMRDGSVPGVSIEIEKSSGVSVFDDRALAAIERAATQHAFDPLPSGFNSESLPVVFNFRVIPEGGP